jgi:hypothetical protein
MGAVIDDSNLPPFVGEMSGRTEGSVPAIIYPTEIK